MDGKFVFDGEYARLYCGVKRGDKKNFKRNKKEYERLADHIGVVPLVMIAPSDSALIREGSDVRRKFMDGIIAQYDRSYLDHLLNYNRVLAQRNALLKYQRAERKFDETSLNVFDEQLDQYGSQIHVSRVSFLEKYLPIFSNFYGLISGGAEEVGISYSSQLSEKSLLELLQENRQRDFSAQYTTQGVHKDDLVFEIRDFPMKKFGSQGQQKSFVIALRLAQFDYLKDLKQRKPILLLDDIFDKLDDERVAALMKLVSEEHFGQIFITDANLHRVPELFRDEAIPIKKLLVEAGEIKDL